MDIKKQLKDISDAEGYIREISKVIAIEQANKRKAETELASMKAEILAYMQENGIQQDQVEDGICKLLVTLHEGRESVDCPDIDAVPDEFINTTRVVNKKAVAEHLKDAALPNWARMKRGEPYISIKAVMK